MTDLIPRDESDEPSVQVQLAYYVCTLADKDFSLGQYVRVTHVDGQGNVSFQYREYTYRDDTASFLRHFTYAPEGEAVVQAQIAALMADINREGAEIAALHQALAQATPYLAVGAQAAAGLEAIEALVPIEDRSLIGIKRTLATVQHLARSRQEALQTKQRQLQALLAEQLAVVNALVKPLEELIGRLQEGVWTINLYLGRDEQIVLLRDGQPAPADTPLVLRQLVLAMDEEAAVLTERGGIDALTIEQFDAWLLADPKHLDQVLPEPKAVVVLVPRWSEKDYGDPWRNADMRRHNLQSYFLLRNGERIYRMVTDFVVGRTLIPTRDEFLSLFFEQRYDHKSGGYQRIPLEVGSRAYMEAEKKADARNRHYMRIALILQGLIDRTTIFQPLPPNGIQITRQEAFDRGLVRLISDAEMTLSDGRERFDDWRARINGELEVGMRIIGVFNTYAGFSAMRENDYTHPRLHPARDSGPRSNTLYRLEGRRGDGFVFYYKRDDHGYLELERRGSCVVKPADGFILAFDAATVEEMEYYLANRLDRRSYLEMFPLLKTAIRLKREEAAQEAPFRQLLAGQIVLRHGVDHETAAAEVDDLVRYYKFKARYHRPLVGDDDGKALRMIVGEFGVRLRERENRIQREQRGEFAQVRDLVLALHPDTLLLAHKRGNEYVALLPHNDEPIYATEITLTPAGQVRERREWRIVDRRFERWGVFYTSERWASWHINASRSEHLTDPEIDATGKLLHARIATRRDAGAGVLLAVTFDREANAFHTYAVREFAVIPGADRLLSEALKAEVIESLAYPWSRNQQREVVLAERANGAGFDRRSWPDDGRAPWSAHQYRRVSMWGRSLCQKAEIIIFENGEVVAQLGAAHTAYQEAKGRIAELERAVGKMQAGLRRQWEARAEQQAYESFLVEYANVELWEGHRKSLKLPEYPHQHNRLIARMLRFFVERGQARAIEGLTVEELTTRYQAAIGADGWSVEDEGQRPTDIATFVITTQQRAP